MKKTVQLLILALFLVSFSTAFGQIYMDGKATDWDAYPVIVEAQDNLDGVFPTEVGAVVSDIVDIKALKGKVIDNVLYGYMEFWGGPVWPNNAYENDRDGTLYYASRGYYHFLLDIDNDATTGWSTDWYEAHYTPLGYLISQGVTASPIGAEVMTECFYRTNDAWQVANEGANPIRGYGQWAADYSEYNGETDLGSDYEIFDMNVPNADSARVMAWQGSLLIDSSDDEALANDTLRSYWIGQAWGNNFLEFGIELTPFQKYFMNKDGSSVFQPGDVIALCGMTETPIDDWGVDMTTRGEITIPADVRTRPEIITFDGDESDWAGLPVLLEAQDNLDGVFPTEVGAVVSDIVDIKEIKGFIDGDNLFFNMKFWGGPVWPNNAYENDRDGTLYYASRGYYHLLIDLDNDVTTGWSTDWYEAHYTPLGYLISQGVTVAPIGAEVMQENFFRTNDAWQVANEDKNLVRDCGQWAADYEEYNGETDLGSDYEIYNYDVMEADSASLVSFDGLQINNSSDADILDGNPDWIAHAWGNDFIETGVSLRAIKKYYKAKDGRDVFQTGDVIAVCGMTETPIDDWGVDMTTRGEIIVTVVGVEDEKPAIVNEFSLANNYPNPFNPETNINFSVPNLSNVSLVIYNTLGQKVRTLVDNKDLSGNQTAVWNGKNDFGSSVPSGIYYYRMESGSSMITKSMVLLK